MNNITVVSILVLLSLFCFFMYELATVIRISNKKVKGKKGIHILGVLTTLLITICVALSMFDVNYDSKVLIISTVILSVLFYIGFAWQTLFEVKEVMKNPNK